MNRRRSSIPAFRPSRAHWVKLIGDAQRLLRRLTAGEGSAEEVAAFERGLRGVRGETFPGAPVATTRRIAEGFVQLGTAFCLAAPGRRETIAPLLDGCAALLDGALEDLRAHEAGATWQARGGD